ncbi:holo-acyl-carrier-protein synthase [Seiridium cupressi]
MSFPMGLGHDICKIRRIFKILETKRGSGFIKRILTEEELRTPRSQILLRCVTENSEGSIPVAGAAPKKDTDLWKAAEYMAGRFAAKEAVVKAFHQQRITFHDIELVTRPAVTRNFSGPLVKPEQWPHKGQREPWREAKKHGKMPEATEPFDEQLSSGPPTAFIRVEGASEKQSALVSITHDGEYASAVCMYFPAQQLVEKRLDELVEKRLDELAGRDTTRWSWSRTDSMS